MTDSRDSLRELVRVMDRLRSPGGCPWDARQTHHSLVEYLVEEAYETVEAIEAGDRDDLREELGDLLLQVVFHARIAQEDADDPWDIDDVADGIVRKLIRRHPHVFADASADTAEEVEARWHELKAAEKGRASVTDGIPPSLPALVLAAKLLARSESLTVEVPGQPSADVVLADLESEEQLGELLLGVVAAARARGWDAEAALRGAARQQRDRIRRAEST
ncbi:MAG: nucleoside triphosphate pyrophosphohydrolase [Actinomycetales bacterium mxb001]|nr:MAG: nucleoside triphosphate pyrophosphohydrolase [Actinomycetales bacterium mxb001]